MRAAEGGTGRQQFSLGQAVIRAAPAAASAGTGAAPVPVRRRRRVPEKRERRPLQGAPRFFWERAGSPKPGPCSFYPCQNPVTPSPIPGTAGAALPAPAPDCRNPNQSSVISQHRLPVRVASGPSAPPPQPKPNRAKTRTIWTVRQSRHPDSIAHMQNKPPIAGTRSARALELQKTQNGATLRSRRKPSGELTGCRCQLAVGRGLTSTGTPRTVHRHERRAERGGALWRIPPRCGFGSSHTRMAYCGLVLRKALCTIAFWRRKHTRQRHEKPPMRNSAGTAPPHPGRPNPWGSAVDPMQNEPSRRYVRRGGVDGAENPRRHTAPTVPQSVWEFYGRL